MPRRTFSSKRRTVSKRRTASKRISKRTSKSMVVRGGALLVELTKDGEMYHHEITLSDDELGMTCEKVVIPLLKKLEKPGESVDYGINYIVKVDGRTPKQNHTLEQAIKESKIQDGVLHSILLSNPRFSRVGGKK
jgi:hypothetical protein